MIKQRMTVAATVICLLATPHTLSQQRIHYSGSTLSNPMRHDGGLSPLMGVHNIQTMRANREHPVTENGNGWTYNHQPMMAYHHGCFYIHYLSNLSDEHIPPSRTMMQSSQDGYTWTDPIILFPEYDVPEGYTKPRRTEKAHNLKAVMHQRVGFYTSKNDILLAMGNYGIAFDAKDDPNDGNGIGRVVRQINDDSTLGQIYFIYYNHGFNTDNTAYPHYSKAPKAIRKACEEILTNPRYMMQWVEEADRDDTIIPLQRPYKAYCDYTLPDGRLVCLWKHALTSVSSDDGHTWEEPVERACGFVNSNAKIWGQRLTDKTYATVYNPSEYRWPLALSLSADGIDYTTLNLVCGEVPPMRYGGNYKSYGPQYVRGIQEGNGIPVDSNLWVTYSMNKEDMWVARIPVPAITQAHAHARDSFSIFNNLAQLTQWNIYSPVMAHVALNKEWLTMTDSDPFDYACIERKIPETRELHVEFDLKTGQNNNGRLQIEFLDKCGTACSRLELTPEGIMTLKGGARVGHITDYEAGKKYHVEIILSVQNRMARVLINGKERCKRMFFAPVKSIERIMFRTGKRRTTPNTDTPADWYGTLPNAGHTGITATFAIANFCTSSADADDNAAFLYADEYRHYVNYFNSMENENIVQAIPNDSAWQWMTKNIPLFDCPDKQMEQIYYFRWWTLRKHIKHTPMGYAMTEFLVKRSYADQYNLISSALGHHILESRWIRNPKYLDEIINTWYHGNNGKPMEKLTAYSSWTSAALWERYKTDGRRNWITTVLPSLCREYNYWNFTHRLANGLFWQSDVQDAMEETISGGRKKQYARPSINCYMYGNARAIAAISRLAGHEADAQLYELRADTIRQLVTDRLWSSRDLFFETLKGDTLAKVREAIGFLPWYVGLTVGEEKYDIAWQQLSDSKGFSAPYGITTAEQRHPLFRSHGIGQCEWDGAVWPFATSQTLTAFANHLRTQTDRGKEWTDSALFYREMKKYTECQSHRGRPYIGEYLDESTGYWLKGDQERSRYYNHSTFCDLIITGICGLRPREDNQIEIIPLLPENLWNYFCIDNVAYHGYNISIIWDKDGSRYHAGKGLRLYVNGILKAQRNTLGKLLYHL